MFKGHPKGLFVAFFANMGERFGYYTMLAIFILYLQAKFGWSATESGRVYGAFLFGIYFLPLLGGYIADNILGYGKTITLGTIIMFFGYALLAVPGTGEYFIYVALATISLGTGLFKGNLQALVGNMYDSPKYGAFRDSAFNIFYMGINVGAFFAPNAAKAIRNFLMHREGLVYDKSIADMSHKFIDGSLGTKVAEFESLARTQMGDAFTNLTDFSHKYIDGLGQAYNAGFAIASISMLISLAIFLGFRKYYKDADVTHKQQKKAKIDGLVELSPKQVKDRLLAMGLVFLVVIFFWMAFHQNGFTLTIFARDYTVASVNKATAVIFNLSSLLPVLGVIIGVVLLFGRENSRNVKLSALALIVAGSAVGYYVISQYQPEGNPISPEIFQQFNPIFIVFLTPVIVGYFAWLRKKGMEPSSPKKIGIGMILTAIGFGIMMLASRGMLSPSDLNGSVSEELVSPYWLIGTYLTLTVAELFLSPIGISFISKVSPPQYKGLAQGGWFGATAIGNLAAGLIGPFWDKWELWQFFALLVVLCLLSALFIFSILKVLERAANS
ncbi:MAG: peptide MFS transporter [Bacteroidales bacterium]|nr:peptide MFS transporter [Bacteroidales bacterium]MCB8998449.1 peptide MFS transporter [Bacteroidales bacterium]MCB9012892.1 peptide MFS transporter [Bacteroidales bacterium]